MEGLITYLKQIPWGVAVLLCLTLGLAPFVPEPHLFEKARMVMRGDLARPIDIFDLLLHAAPFALLFLKLFASTRG